MQVVPRAQMLSLSQEFIEMRSQLGVIVRWGCEACLLSSYSVYPWNARCGS